jgi:hypothetical protein
MAKPTYKFKNVDAGKDPLTGQKLYQQVMLVEYDGKTSSYKTAKHRSQERLKNDTDRMIASIQASLGDGSPVTTRQNYGEAEFRTVGSEDIAKAVKEGGQLKAPETYELVRDVDGMQNVQRYDQRGIRQGESITRAPANMLDPNYDPITDTIKPPSGQAAQADSTARMAAFDMAKAASKSKPSASLFNRNVSMIAGEGPASDMSPVTRMRSLLAGRGMRNM